MLPPVIIPFGFVKVIEGFTLINSKGMPKVFAATWATCNNNIVS